MQTVRALLKLFIFLVITKYYYLKIVVGYLFIPFGLNRFKWSSEGRKQWGRAITRLMGIKTTVIGTPPDPPFFLVSNHLSYSDVWVLFGHLNCTFIAKSDVKHWPVVGFMLKTSGILFVDREKRSDVTRVNEEVSENLNKFQGIVLFPEGTTSSGADILPFKSSLFQYPARHELPVSCASVSYATFPDNSLACNQICWWDDTPFFVHLINMLKMKEFSATITFSEERIINPNRKLLAGYAEKTIRRNFEPVIQPEEHAETNISS